MVPVSVCKFQKSVFQRHDNAYSQIMESLVRLAKTYVQLCNDGCVLFLDWTVEFLCDIKRPVCCVSEFASQGKLKGHRSTQEDLEVSVAMFKF